MNSLHSKDAFGKSYYWNYFKALTPRKVAALIWHDLGIATKELRRSKCNFVLGFIACLLSVTIVAVLYTALSFTPIFFLRIAETEFGEFDVSISAGGFVNSDAFNFTAASQVLDQNEDTKYSSPRLVFEEATGYASCTEEIYANSSRRYVGLSPGGLPCSGGARGTDGCLPDYCSSTTSLTLYAIDFDREEFMGLGRSWALGKAKPGEIYLQSSVASELGIDIGAKLVVALRAGETLAGWVTNASLPVWETSQGKKIIAPDLATFSLQFTLAGVFEESGGKTPLLERQIGFISHEDLTALVYQQMHPQTPELLRNAVRAAKATDATSIAYFNMKPPRFTAYTSSNFVDIQDSVVGFSTTVIRTLGYGNVNGDVPVLRRILSLRIFNLFLGLILAIILVVLCLLLGVLIYSLLLISVETRTFDLGVLRMSGLSRPGLVRLILVQAAVTSIPAWIMGLIFASVVTSALLNALSSITNTNVPAGLSPAAVGWATLIGLAVPALASISPVLTALGTSMAKALDTKRSAAPAIKYTYERSQNTKAPKAVIAGGSFFSILGILLYILFPAALLRFDFTLLLGIFFALLMGILAGLVILSLNVEILIETSVCHLLLWPFPRSIRTVVMKNLVTHRMRNRKTFFMYSLSIAFIVFIAVTFSIQIKSLEFQEQKEQGSLLRANFGEYVPLSQLKLLSDWADQQPLIDGVGWMSQPLKSLESVAVTKVENLGKVYSFNQKVRTVSPNFFDIAIPGYLRTNSEVASPFPLSESLYSPRGSQSWILGSLFKSEIGLDLSTDSLMRVSSSTVLQSGNIYIGKPLAFVDGAPALEMSVYPENSEQDALVSIPSYLSMASNVLSSADDIPLGAILFKIKEGVIVDELSSLRDSLISAVQISGMQVYDYSDASQGWDVAAQAVGFITSFTTGITMIVCYFSLSASMYANIFEQRSEIGILRSLGCTRAKLVTIFVLESFALVTSATLVGCMIGAVVGLAVTFQRAIFSQLPVPFLFPLPLVITLAFLAALSATAASAGPAWSTVKRKVVENLRGSG